MTNPQLCPAVWGFLKAINMKPDNINIGGIYYYNNRQVLVISREGETDFFKCLIKFNVGEVDGGCFCDHCMVGGGSNIPAMDCVADNYQAVIDSIIEEIESNQMNHELIFAHSSYLNQHPFEYKENQKLISENLTLSNEINDKNLILINLKNEIKASEQQSLAISNDINSKVTALEAINSEIKEMRIKANELAITEAKKSVLIENSTKTIPIADLLSLIRNSIILENLNSGGVDNWDWYGESVGDDDDIEKEALSRLLELREVNHES